MRKSEAVSITVCQVLFLSNDPARSTILVNFEGPMRSLDYLEIWFSFDVDNARGPPVL